jgi:hypothetical protein
MLSIYTDKSFSSAYSQTNFTIGLIVLVTSSIKLTHHWTVWLLFHFFYSHCDSLGIYREYIIVGVFRQIKGWKIWSVNVTAIYRWKNFIGVSICICQFSGSLKYKCLAILILHLEKKNQQYMQSIIIFQATTSPFNNLDGKENSMKFSNI